MAKQYYDHAALKANDYSDEEIAKFEAEAAASDPQNAPSASHISAPGSATDPSAGGGELSILGHDTGIHTPQWLDRTLAGTGRGMTHTVKSVGNMLGLVSNEDLKDEADVDRPLMATTAGKAGNLIGETAITAPLGLGVGGAAARGAAALGAEGLGANALLQGSLQGATQGVATADPGDRLTEGLGGAFGGALLPGISSVTGKLINGLKRTGAADRLLKEGIDLTPGQMHPEGIANQLEQSAESLGVAKQLVHPARDAAETQMHARFIQEGAAPGTKITPSADLSDMLRQAQESYKPLYDEVRGFQVGPHIMGNTNVPLNKALSRAASAPGIPTQIQNSVKAEIDSQYKAMVAQAKKDGGMKSDHLLDFQSWLRAQSRDLATNTDLASKQTKRAYDAADRKVTEALDSQLPTSAMDSKRLADSRYGVYKVVEDAVAHAKDNLAGLTPTKISDAIYRATSDPSYAKNQIGNLANLRSLAKDAGEVFQNVSPPTGARAVTIGGAAGASVLAPHIAIPALGVGTLLTAAQSGRKIAQGATRPQRLAQALQDRIGSTVDRTLNPLNSTVLGPTAASDAKKAAGAVAGRLTTAAGAPYAPQALAAALAAHPFLTRGLSGQKPEEEARK